MISVLKARKGGRTKKLWEVMGVLITWVVVMVTLLYTYTQTHKLCILCTVFKQTNKQKNH